MRHSFKGVPILRAVCRHFGRSSKAMELRMGRLEVYEFLGAQLMDRKGIGMGICSRMEWAKILSLFCAKMKTDKKWEEMQR